MGYGKNGLWGVGGIERIRDGAQVTGATRRQVEMRRSSSVGASASCYGADAAQGGLWSIRDHPPPSDIRGGPAADPRSAMPFPPRMRRFGVRWVAASSRAARGGARQSAPIARRGDRRWTRVRAASPQHRERGRIPRDPRGPPHSDSHRPPSSAVRRSTRPHRAPAGPNGNNSKMRPRPWRQHPIAPFSQRPAAPLTSPGAPPVYGPVGFSPAKTSLRRAALRRVVERQKSHIACSSSRVTVSVKTASSALSASVFSAQRAST